MTDKSCPFFKSACIDKDCALWVCKTTVIVGKGSEEETVVVEAMCSVRAIGLSVLPTIGKYFYPPEVLE